MPTKIDEFFAPERLRKNWQRSQKPSKGSEHVKTEAQSPLEVFSRLQSLIRSRFSGDNLVVLNLFLDQLHTLLITAFPSSGEDKAPEENQAEPIPAIHELLNRIEDIVDAFETAGRNR
jgi:hypothetical protein